LIAPLLQEVVPVIDAKHINYLQCDTPEKLSGTVLTGVIDKANWAVIQLITEQHLLITNATFRLPRYGFSM